MTPAIQVRRLANGAIQARRKDGKPLTAEDREQARRLAAHESKLPAVDQIIDDRTLAVLIDSTVVGAPIWFAFRDGWKPEEADNIPVFYASELAALRTKTPQQLRSIFNCKRTFGGGGVRQ